MSKQNELTYRFLEACTYLVSVGLVKNFSEIADKLGVSRSLMTEVKKGRTNITFDKIQSITEFYPISSTWLSFGSGLMITSASDEFRPMKAYKYLLDKGFISDAGEFMQQLGIDQATFNKMTNGSLDDSVGLALKIASRYPQVEFLFARDGKNTPTVPVPGGIPLIQPPMDVGAISYFEQMPKSGNELYRVPGMESCDFLMKISGQYLPENYLSGDVVGCKIAIGEKIIQWGKVYLLETSQGNMVKRILPGANKDSVSVVSDDRFPGFDLPRKEIYRLALVIGMVRME